MYLIDTNIFLEILLNQTKKDQCKEFLGSHIEELSISDFSLHSIGVILFRNNQEASFEDFIDDLFTDVRIFTLPKESYKNLPRIKKEFRLDFDDAYQYGVAKAHALQLVTMDLHFRNIKNDNNIIFI